MPYLKTYLFKDKDPVIDILRTLIQIYAAQGNMSFGKALKEIAGKANIHVTTLHKWFYQDTISPRFCYIAAVVRVVKAPFRIGNQQVGERRQLKLVKGGRAA